MRAQSVIRPTKARPGAAEQRVVMRSIALLLITCLWYGCHAAEDLRGELVAFVSGEEEVAPDPLVHCRVGESGQFVRESRCERLGGWVDEPLWARSP
ncbi:MAG: hypothetical protein V3U03_01330 [Myxococcota bacterium]